MRQTPNVPLANANTNKATVNKPERKSVNEPTTQNIQTSLSPPTSSNQQSNLPDTSLSPKVKRSKNKNKSVDVSDDLSSLNKVDLPKINNPRAETRLKALVGLLDKRSRSPKSEQDLSFDKSVKEKKIPSLPCLSSRPSEREEFENVKKMVPKSPQKIVFKKVGVESPEASAQQQNKHTPPKYLAPLKYPGSHKTEKEKKADVMFASMRRRVKNIFSDHNSKNLFIQEVLMGSIGDDGSLEMEVNSYKRRENPRRLREIPEPAHNFESRVHKLSIGKRIYEK